jgi:hypothetical protein
MPNLAFHLEVLDQVIEKRAALNDPVAVKLKNPANDKLRRTAALGAMGPDVFQYTPISRKLASFLSDLIPPAISTTVLTQNQIDQKAAAAQAALQTLSSTNLSLGLELYFNPLGAIYSVLFSSLVIPVWPTLDKATDFFNLLSGLVADHSNLELAEKLPGILSELPEMTDITKGLAGLPAAIAVMQVVIGGVLTLPPWMESNQTFPQPTEITMDRRYEFLRWHKTDQFAQALEKFAETDEQKAYAFGWLSHLAASVTSEPFINNITGGPYRTHWWRNRLAGNFVDSWTFGFFEQSPVPTMSGDNPSPFYFDPLTGDGWPALSVAGNLQDRFNIGALADAPADDVPEAVKAMATGDLGTLADQFPAGINDLVSKALAATYPVLPMAGVGVSAFDTDTLPRAFVGAFSVYWFMTSGRGALGSHVLGPGTGQPEPSWISSGSSPSPSQAGVNVGAAVCGLVLAILGVLLILLGDLPAGLAALGAALNQPIIDWDTVANELFWLKKELIDAENALQDALVMSGLAYPPPVMLGARVNLTGTDETLPVTDLTPPSDPNVTAVPNITGIPLCKSNGFNTDNPLRSKFPYPRRMDTRSTAAPNADLNFAVYPDVEGEQPLTANPIAANLYPNAFVNGLGLQNGGMMAPGTYPSTYRFFGDALSNALQLMEAGADKLTRYNMDGDRGYGWHCWNPKPGTNPAVPPVVDVEEV